jgi:hypothetical protein
MDTLENIAYAGIAAWYIIFIFVPILVVVALLVIEPFRSQSTRSDADQGEVDAYLWNDKTTQDPEEIWHPKQTTQELDLKELLALYKENPRLFD